MDASISLYRKIRRLYRLGQRYSMNHRTQGDLSPSEFQLLRHVGFHGEVSQRHLAEDLSVDKAMITRTLQKLEAKGYLVRVEEAKDGRSKKVIALPAAKRIHQEGRGLDEQFSDILTEGFSKEELQTLDRLLGVMADRAKALLDRAESEMGGPGK